MPRRRRGGRSRPTGTRQNGNSTHPAAPLNRLGTTVPTTASLDITSTDTVGVAIVCLKCRRVPSPEENPIVFCSKCDRTWHKFCHIPVVPNEVIDREDVDWFCGRCTALMADNSGYITQRLGSGSKPGSPRVTIRIKKGLVSTINEVTISPSQLKSCRSLTIEQKTAYFSSLSRESLIDLLMHASENSPDLNLYNPDLTTVTVADTTKFLNGVKPPSSSTSSPSSLMNSIPRTQLTLVHKGTPKSGTCKSPNLAISGTTQQHTGDPNTPPLELDPQSYFPLPGAGLMRELMQRPDTRGQEWLTIDDDSGYAFSRTLHPSPLRT